jgi:hypothetical protein
MRGLGWPASFSSSDRSAGAGLKLSSSDSESPANWNGAAAAISTVSVANRASVRESIREEAIRDGKVQSEMLGSGEKKGGCAVFAKLQGTKTAFNDVESAATRRSELQVQVGRLRLVPVRNSARPLHEPFSAGPTAGFSLGFEHRNSHQPTSSTDKKDLMIARNGSLRPLPKCLTGGLSNKPNLRRSSGQDRIIISGG